MVPGVTILGGAVFDTRNFRTDLTAKNGQTLVLGGIIQKQITDTLYKTPLLGDIPGLKWLFNKRDKSSHEVELMVFLRPKVTRTPRGCQRTDERDLRKGAEREEVEGRAAPEEGRRPRNGSARET